MNPSNPEHAASSESFDPLAIDIEGINLIEASAGTGKTWNISALVLRLIMEGRQQIGEILVITFTEAATAELKDRTRSRLSEALQQVRRHLSRDGNSETTDCHAMADKNGTDDEFVTRLLATADSTEAVQQFEKRLLAAVRSFDEAAIFTIHGFCHRMLHENAFESRIGFDVELDENPHNLTAALLDDFWMTEFKEFPDAFIEFMKTRKISYKVFATLAERISRKDDVTILPDYQEVRPMREDVQLLLKDKLDRASRTLAQAKLALRELFMQAWRQAPPAKAFAEDRLPETRRILGIQVPKNAIRWFADLNASNPPSWLKKLLAETSSDAEDPDADTDPLLGAARKFMDQAEVCATLTEEVANNLAPAHHQQMMTNLFHRWLSFRDEQAEARKRSENVQFFDDLLYDLKRALAGDTEGMLAQRLRAQYPVALIDEFQDTDPVQYEIVRTIFGHKDATLFMIGDPKQSIYGFRRADVFAYMNASRIARRAPSLLTNYRSEPGIMAAVNELFGVPNSFLHPGIQFEPGHSAAQAQLRFEGQPVAQPFEVMQYRRSHKKNNEGQQETLITGRSNIIKVVAREVAQMIQASRLGKWTIDGRPLLPGDIAILVRTNYQTRELQKELLACGVHSVRKNSENVLRSYEADQLLIVLHAIKEPHRVPEMRAALLGPLFGLLASEIADWEQHPEQRDAWLTFFRDCRDMWIERGFIAVMGRILERGRALPRYLAGPEGERRATNLLHLIELLGAEDKGTSSGMLQLIHWFEDQRQRDAKEWELRLESDAERVNLLTMHTSKGLEFSVVFCPFNWDYKYDDHREQMVLFHDAARDHVLTLDIRGEESDAFLTHRVQHTCERLAEDLRLLYVALTRAKHRCVVITGNLKSVQDSGLAWLLHSKSTKAATTDGKAEADFLTLAEKVQLTADRVKDLSDEDMEREIRQRLANCPSIQVRRLPKSHSDSVQVGDPVRSADALAQLTPKVFRREVDRNWRIQSFSSLIAGQIDFDHPDHDSHAARAMEWDEPEGIFAFPKGTQAGSFLHAVFENIDFRAGREAIWKEVEVQLKTFGFDEKRWSETVCDMMQNVLHTPLILEGGRPRELRHPGGTPSVAPNPLEGETLSSCESTEFLGCGGTDVDVHPTGLLRLDLIPPEDRLNEMEFYFPVAGESLFGEETQPGHMKGFIDLIFIHEGRWYIADYKSNHLGNHADDYYPVALEAEMQRHKYKLQYHLYTLALHRYLQARLPDYCYEEHFGGVFYLFIRGMQPDNNGATGVYFDRPALAEIELFSLHPVGST